MQDITPHEQTNPTGYKFSSHVPSVVEKGIGAPFTFESEFPPEPERLPHFGNFDYSKRYQASAILSEHDISARNQATRQMEEDPKYSHLKYGEAPYFVQWEELVRSNIQELIRTKGAPKYSYDGATGLPLLSFYQN